MARRRKRYIVLGSILAAGLLLTTVTIGTGRELVETVNVYWTVHDEVLLPTEAGRRYIDIGWAFNDEMFQLGTQYPDIREKTVVLLLTLEPAFDALVDGRGDEVSLSVDDVALIEAYSSRLLEVGSPALQRTILEETARYPLETFIGVTMEAARVRVLGSPLEATPSPMP